MAGELGEARVHQQLPRGKRKMSRYCDNLMGTVQMVLRETILPWCGLIGDFMEYLWRRQNNVSGCPFLVLSSMVVNINLWIQFLLGIHIRA